MLAMGHETISLFIFCVGTYSIRHGFLTAGMLYIRGYIQGKEE